MKIKDLSTEKREQLQKYIDEYKGYLLTADEAERGEILRKVHELCVVEFGLDGSECLEVRRMLGIEVDEQEHNCMCRDIKSLKTCVIVLCFVVFWLCTKVK